MKAMNSTSPARTIFQLLPIMFLIVGLTACTDTQDGDVTTMDTTALPVDTADARMGGDMAFTDGDTIEVSLVEFEIDMPMNVPEGNTTFQITNDGTTEHSFEVEGQGIEESLTQNLMPGDSTTLQVDLDPGSYTVYCPVDNHREQGMEVQLTVEESQEGMAGF